jgi:surfactin synthase thioesterase subunit
MTETTSRSWIVRPRSVATPRVRLLCFPHAGGGAAGYRDWARKFPDLLVEVCGVEFPGRGGRRAERLPVSISEIVDATTEEFCTHYAETPVAVFGHSFGALIAFEFSRRVSALGVGLIHLFVSGHVAPQLPDPKPPMRYLSDTKFIFEMIRRYDGIPAEILREREMMQLLLPILRADITMKETYRYLGGPLLKCPISAFGGREDSSVTTDDLDAWRAQTSGAFKLRMFPGGHFFIQNEREFFLRAVAEELNGSIHEVS